MASLAPRLSSQRRLHEVLGTPSVADRLARDELLSVLEKDPVSAPLAEARRREIMQVHCVRTTSCLPQSRTLSPNL